MLFPYIIDDEMVQHFERLGVRKLFKLLGQKYSTITSFDKSLLNSIHWFASFTTQLEHENQVLNLLMSLEALLTPKDNNPIGTAIIASVLGAIGIEKLRGGKKISGESALALFLSGSLAIATVVIGLAKGLSVNLFSFLFGSIATVSLTDLYLIIGLGIIFLVTIIFFYN